MNKTPDQKSYGYSFHSASGITDAKGIELMFNIDKETLEEQTKNGKVLKAKYNKFNLYVYET